MQYKAVLFDLDGTLLNTLTDLANAGNRMLAAHSWPTHPVDAYRYFVGAGIATLVEKLLPEDQRQPEHIAAALTGFKQEYEKNWRECTDLYPGIAEMLDQLIATGAKIAILSNKPDGFTQLCVQEFLSSWPFAPILGQRPGVPKKPDPAGALDAARLLGCSPKEVLYAGDTSIDMHTAVSAGMEPVGVLWGFRDADELRTSGARHLIAHPRELVSLFAASL